MRIALVPFLAAALLSAAGSAAAGAEPVPSPSPAPALPPRPPPAPPSDSAGEGPILDDAPWGLAPDLVARLQAKAGVYVDYAVRFTSMETVRLASYDGGEAEKEKVRKYSYLLERGATGEDFREIRQRLRADGTPRPEEVADAEPFPPAYAWVFLFGRPFQPYFLYRDRGERFEGFDWVHEVEFRGALPFTDGKDIRQWEGRVLFDAMTLTPLEIQAEPSRQGERIRAAFARWKQSFSIVGMHTAPKPLGYRCRVVFRLRRDALTFPTELRYDTFLATGQRTSELRSASIRNYDDYRFFKTETIESEPATKAP